MGRKEREMERGMEENSFLVGSFFEEAYEEAWAIHLAS